MSKDQDIQKEIYKTKIQGDIAIEVTGSLVEKTAKAYQEYKDSLLKNTGDIPTSNIATQTDGVDDELKKEFENGINDTTEQSSSIKTSLVEGQDKKNTIETAKEEGSSINRQEVSLNKEGTSDDMASSPLLQSNQNDVQVQSRIKTAVSDHTDTLNGEQQTENNYTTLLKTDVKTNDIINSENESENESEVIEDNVVTDEVMSQEKTKTSKVEKAGRGMAKVGKGMAFVTKAQRSVSSIQTSVEKQDGGKTVYKTAGKQIINKKVRNSKPVKAVKKTAIKGTTKILKSLIKLVMAILKKIILLAVSSLPFLLPVMLAFCLLIGILSCFGFLADDENIFDYYENYIIETNNEYRDQISSFEEKDEDNRIIGISNIDWQTPLSIVQQLGGSTEFDDAEKELLNEFKDSDLYEVHTIQKQTIQKEVEYEVEVEIEKDGKKEKVKEKRTKIEDKEIQVMTITNPSYDDYMSWLESHTDVIKRFKNKKGLGTSDNALITEDDKEYIKFLSQSNNFYDLASDNLKNSICYNGNGAVVKGDSEIGNKIAELALSRQGYMYLWGGCHSMAEIKNPNHTRFDCSGLVSWAYYQAGADIGSNTCSTLVKKGRTITYEQLQAGDIVLYSNATDGLHHVAIYIGGGKVVHAPRTGKPVSVVNAKWSSEVMIYKRLLDY